MDYNLNQTEDQLQGNQASKSQEPEVVDDLQHELEQHKARVAPIRRIPHDVLSLIFLQACQTDPMAPFILGGVCTIWRRSLLDTHHAWTFVQLHRLKTFDAIRLVLDRGAPCPLYLDVSSRTSVHLSLALKGHAERVRCLRMDISFFKLLQSPFSNLTKLAMIGVMDAFVDGSWKLLDGIKFPKLRCLHSNILLDSLTGTLPPHTMFPPIEEFSLVTKDPRFLAGIIENLAHKLTLLHIVILEPDYQTDYDQPREILFPRLLDLTIIQPLSWTKAPLWPFNAHTSVLRSYKQDPTLPGSNIHKDTQMVTSLGFRLKIDLQLFPRLHEVTSDPPGIHDLMWDLEEDPQRWPDLKTVHCKYQGDIEERVKNFNATYGREIHCNLTELGPPFLADPCYFWVEFPARYNFN